MGTGGLSARDRDVVLNALRRLGRAPRAARRLAFVLERLGAFTLADHVDRLRSGHDLVSISLPTSTTQLRVARIRMYAFHGTDQVVRQLRSAGWSSFEHPLPSVVVTLLRRLHGTFLDVGANTGFYALLAAASSRRVAVVAFEPVPDIRALLDANLTENRVAARITVRQAAVSDQVGVAELHLPTPQDDGTIETSASLQSDFKDVIDHVLHVTTTTLDAVWRDLGSPRISVIKIDVEGAEALTIRGARELVAACRPIVAVEILERGDTRAVNDLIERERYVDVLLRPHEVVIHPGPAAPDAMAPNHLLVPAESVAVVEAALRYIPSLPVRDLRGCVVTATSRRDVRAAAG